MSQILVKVLHLLTKNERHKIYRLVFFDAIISLLDIAFLALLLWLLSFYTGGKANAGVSAVLHPAIANPVLAIGIFFILFSLKNWFGYRLLVFQHHFFYDVASRLSKKNLMHYLRNNYLQFIHVDSSVRTREISQQPVEFSHYILNNLQQIATQSLLILFAICAILFYHPVLFLLLLVFLLPPVVVLGIIIRKRSKQIRTQTQTASQKTIQYLQESLAGYIESNIYNKSEFFTNRYYQYQNELNSNLATQQTLMSLPTRLIEVFAILGIFILALVSQYSSGKAAPDLFTIGVFMAAAYKIIPGMVKILNSVGQIRTYEPTLDSLAAFEETVTLPTNGQKINKIKFEQVSFKYDQEPVLTNLSFELKPGDMAALWGRSGSGKSTILHLILGFLSTKKGKVLINDEANLELYRRHLSYVKQQPYFIYDTLAKNITLDNVNYNVQKMNEIITFCGLNNLVQSYPDGLHTLITENGKNISGGQRQRIMLARALYHDFDVLVLDEPFSEMDKAAETGILTQLQLLAAKGKIIVLVTHNPNSLSHCNKVIDLDGKD